MIQVSLWGFRNYHQAAFTFSHRTICLTGPNGAGKTNMLEALSLLTPGRGLRGAKPQAMQNAQCPYPWKITVAFETPTGPLEVQVTWDPEEGKRLLKVNNAPLKTQIALTQWMTVMWLTPTMDRLWTEGWGQRRRYLDRLVFTLYPPYGEAVMQCEKALRERQAVLFQGGGEAWLTSLEIVLAEEMAKIHQWRQQALQDLGAELACHQTSLPVASFQLTGILESRLQGVPSCQWVAYLQELLKQGRWQDHEKKITHVGTHRTAFEIWHPQGQEGIACSTGEQKSLLLSLTLALARLSYRMHPHHIHMLLLDEVVAHLDPEKRQTVLQEVSQWPGYTWMTGTEPFLFESLGPHLCMIRIGSSD